MEGQDQGQVRRPCVVKRNPTTHAEEAAQALLRCPLPPQLEVSYKNSSGVPPLRSSVSESNVSFNTGLLSIRPAKSAFRTFSDGQSSNSQFRRKLESEDSSYDSDYDCACYPTFLPQHDDVSRTASDTLDLELRDDATTAGSKIGDVESSDTEIANLDYINFYKFAVKLGYSEQQASIVLKKLGPNPVLDEFLNGLIQLDKLNSSSQAITTGTKCEEVREPLEEAAQLRYIVIDGSNVAMTHGNKEKFSCRGIQICVDWFLSRGHTNLMVLVPMWRKETSAADYPITDQHILLELERCKLLTFTPSRQSPDGRRIVCYDDRYILQVARDNDAIVVSNDNYRDLAPENPEFRAIVEKRILMYSFVNDRFMPPDDPLGRNGPKLEKFLRKTVAQPCPYNTRCTYGNKCKYYHPERLNNPQKPISEQLVENALKKLPDLGVKKKVTRESSGMSLPTPESMKFGKKPVQRAITSSPTRSLPSSLVEEWPVRDATHQSPLGFPVVSSVQFSVPPPGLPQEDLLNSHRRVARKASLLAPPYPPPLNFGASSHQQVFRNQSAPYQQLSLSNLVLPTTPQLSSSSSDNQLNLLGSTDHLSPQSISSLDTRVPPPFLGGSMREDLEKKRRNIVFHLKAILPEDLVMKAMYLMPEETDAIKICAAISSLAVSNQKSTSPF